MNCPCVARLSIVIGNRRRPGLTRVVAYFAFRGAAPGLLAALLLLVASVAIALADPIAVQIKGFAYHPATITVVVGGSVTWTNEDADAHSATANDGSFDTGLKSQNQSSTVVFNTAGTFAYYCSIHPEMVGTVNVKAVAAPATDTAPGTRNSGNPPGVAALVVALTFLAGALIVGKRWTGEMD